MAQTSINNTGPAKQSIDNKQSSQTVLFDTETKNNFLENVETEKFENKHIQQERPPNRLIRTVENIRAVLDSITLSHVSNKDIYLNILSCLKTISDKYGKILACYFSIKCGPPDLAEIDIWWNSVPKIDYMQANTKYLRFNLEVYAVGCWFGA